MNFHQLFSPLWATLNFFLQQQQQQQHGQLSTSKQELCFLLPLPKHSKQSLLLFTCFCLGINTGQRNLTSHVWCLLSLLCLCFPLGSSLQLLHICIEGWGNWRWSEAFSVDNVGTLLRTIHYKGRTASLIIKVLQLNGVQKQVQSFHLFFLPKGTKYYDTNYSIKSMNDLKIWQVAKIYDWK